MERSPSLPNPSFSRRRRRPAPDYSSRRSQLKLLVLVFALLAMLRLMDEARQPENWKWFVAMQPPEVAEGERGDVDAGDPPLKPVDTRPPVQAAEEDRPEPVIGGSGGAPATTTLWQSSPAESAQTALLNGWTRVWEQLGNKRQNQLSRGLWSYRQDNPWNDQERQAWPDLIAAIRTEWAEHVTRLTQNLQRDQSTLTPAQVQQCRDVAGQLEKTAEEQVSALQSITESAALTPAQRAALAALQQTLDTRAWNAVQDNTVLRSADNEAWERAWERVTAADGITDAEPVTFVQLFAQSKVYRGRAVRVHGTARLGYRVQSRTERRGVDSYYVLWLRPADGGDSPLAVYVASLPPGFPPLGERVAPSNGTPLREEVTVTGLYFKRWLYGSQGGPNLAPLILGTITAWSSSSAATDAENSTPHSAPAAFLLAMAAIFVACCLLGWLVSRWRSQRPTRADDLETEQVLPNFDSAEVRGSVHDSLDTLRGEAHDET